MMETGPPVEVEVNPPASLIRYDAPIFVGLEPSVEAASNVKSSKANEQTAKLEDMLNSMIPPREWVEESGVWMQHVSQEPASRLDIVTLQESLDKALAERKARDTGICPVRDQLYSQCFDEIIRQVVLDGPERGLLLMRTRDEVRMSIGKKLVILPLACLSENFTVHFSHYHRCIQDIIHEQCDFWYKETAEGRRGYSKLGREHCGT